MDFETEQKCVVLAPFSDRFGLVFQNLSSSLKELGVTSTWLGAGVDFTELSSQATRFQIESINLHLVSAELVIADISGNNPNVLYELGIAHGLGKPVLLIGKRDEDRVSTGSLIPFDLRGYLVFWYEDSNVSQLSSYVRMWASNVLGNAALAGANG